MDSLRLPCKYEVSTLIISAVRFHYNFSIIIFEIRQHSLLVNKSPGNQFLALVNSPRQQDVHGILMCDLCRRPIYSLCTFYLLGSKITLKCAKLYHCHFVDFQANGFSPTFPTPFIWVIKRFFIICWHFQYAFKLRHLWILRVVI
jgi:hypothetical protein